MLKVFKKKYDKVFAENHEKMLNKHIRQRNMLELFVRKKALLINTALNITALSIYQMQDYLL